MALFDINKYLVDKFSDIGNVYIIAYKNFSGEPSSNKGGLSIGARHVGVRRAEPQIFSNFLEVFEKNLRKI